jgi:hypothetical protein
MILPRCLSGMISGEEVVTCRTLKRSLIYIPVTKKSLLDQGFSI